MSLAKQENQMLAYFSKEEVQAKFKKLIGERTPAFISSILQIVNSNDLLKNATPASVHSAAATAATLELPLNNTLGFAYIVPFKDSKTQTVVAQFQIGYKGYIQLAQRTGLYNRIATTQVYEGQLIKNDPLQGCVFDWDAQTSDTVIGYVAYFRLTNGFEATLYMSREDVLKHGKRYSKTFDHSYGLWKTNEEAMGKKTVLRLLLSKYAPLSIDTKMQTAMTVDQSEIINAETSEVRYIDNPKTTGHDKEHERAMAMIADCTSPKDLDALRNELGPEYFEAIKSRKDEIYTTVEAE